ncbi:N-acetylmuramoyl-L-alanine amidase [Fibrisoma limi]|nr:N-acetylmuramoyl-L-alanine amidase [Fibrisoma limi]
MGSTRTSAQTTAIQDTLLTGYTTSSLTPLYYGLGTDRLGGARMETLDSGVVLTITGRVDRGPDTTQRLWRIRLAGALTAFVPAAQVTTDTLPTGHSPTGLLTGNWTVYGDTAKPARFDYVAIRLPARLPYRSQQQVDPSRILIDIFGATANTNWITQLRSVQAIRAVWFEQLTDDVFRVYIDLKQAQSWGYSIYYRQSTLIVRVRRPPTRRSLRGLTIAVDAGHGGSNTGARGLQSGLLEKNQTLDVAQRLQKRLERAGATVLMTRLSDTNIGPSDRIRAMRRALPDLLVSIHFNSSGNTAVRGVSTYYKHVGFRRLSEAVLNQLVRARVGKATTSEFGNVGHFNFFFNGPTDYPNVLVEGPFLSNSADEALIATEQYREQMAKAIRRGIKRFVRQK